MQPALTRGGVFARLRSMDTRIDRLQGQLSAQGPLPVYLVCGSESLLRGEAMKCVESAVLAEGLADFNHDRVDLGS